MQARKRWYDHLWMFSLVYLLLGFINILFAWIGLICFFVPLGISITKGNKLYCNQYCGRGQLLELLGNKLNLSGKRNIPDFMKKNWFRYGFLVFFLLMFASMLYSTYLVFGGTNELKEVVKLLWTFKLPWHFAYRTTGIAPWIAQFAFGFYSMMITSTVLGIITMFLYKPRSWCVYCPMGSMTQGICKLKNKS